MDLVHEMRLRMINSPDFNGGNIWAAILYKDSVELLRHPKYLDTEYEIGSTKHLEKKYHRKFEPTRFFNPAGSREAL